jgi:uncharacterized protein YndB with AHSA1/START domain
MATAIVTSDQDSIVSEIDIAAPPERVFKAITDPDEILRRTPQLDLYEMDLCVGGKWRLKMRPTQPHHGCHEIIHDGEVLEVNPPWLLVHTWTANFHKDPHGRSIVRWELSPTKFGTHVKVTHSGLAPEPIARKDYAGGWPGVLQDIKTFLEK